MTEEGQEPPKLKQQTSQGAASASSTSTRNKKHDGCCLCLSCICKRRTQKAASATKSESVEMRERPAKPTTLSAETSLAMTNVQSHQSIKSQYMNDLDIANLRATYVNGAMRIRDNNDVIQNNDVSFETVVF